MTRSFLSVGSRMSRPDCLGSQIAFPHCSDPPERSERQFKTWRFGLGGCIGKRVAQELKVLEQMRCAKAGAMIFLYDFRAEIDELPTVCCASTTGFHDECTAPSAS